MFDDDDLEFLNGPVPPQSSVAPRGNSRVNTETEKGNGPSINLRGSFEELEKSFSSNINEETIERVFGDSKESTKKLE